MPTLGQAAALAIGAGALAGCYGLGDGVLSQGPGAGGAGSDSGAYASPDASQVASGLPCDVEQILGAHCTSCHSDPPAGAPMGLVTYADLTAPAKTDPTKTVAQMSLERIQSTTSPMPRPPASPLSATDVAAFRTWVNAGTPMGSCTPDAGSNPYATPLTCTSGTYWTGGEGSPTMHPGGACIGCHAQSGDAPAYTIAGTVFPSAHEPLDCNGASGVNVVITDAAGQTLTLATNSAGNFFAAASLTLPFSAKVVAGGKERAMGAHQTVGDCNACHGEPPSNGAPGRIMAP